MHLFECSCLENLALCSSSLPGHGDRDDAELLGHVLHRGGGRGSPSWPSLAAALRVQGPAGDRVSGEACRESRLPRDLRHRGHPVPRPAPCRCAQQVPAAPAPQVPLLPAVGPGQCCSHHGLLGEKFVLGKGSVDLCVSAWAGICFGSKQSFPGSLHSVKDAVWGCRLLKWHRTFLYADGNVLLAIFKQGRAWSDLHWWWTGIQRQNWLGSERGLDLVGQNSLPKDVMLPSVFSYDTALGPGPCCYWLQSPFSSNCNSSFTPIQKHVGISLIKFSMRKFFTPQCVLGHFMYLRICGIMIDFSTKSSSSLLQGRWGIQF